MELHTYLNSKGLDIDSTIHVASRRRAGELKTIRIAELLDDYFQKKTKAMSVQKVLFLDELNGHESGNPFAHLVEIAAQINRAILYALENSQAGVGQRGGNWKEIMVDGKIEHTLISQGKKSDYSESDYDLEYRLVRGNY